MQLIEYKSMRDASTFISDRHYLNPISRHIPMQCIELFVAQRIAQLPSQNRYSVAILSLSAVKNHISDPPGSASLWVQILWIREWT